MSEDLLSILLPALDLAVFERSADGTFSSVAPPPAWFGRLAADVTFPFLGHVLDEANRFWRRGVTGAQYWGPSVDADETGREFHYMVGAVTTQNRQFLIFRLDRESDRMRDVLQRVRENALTHDRRQWAAAREARRVGGEVDELLERLRGTSPTTAQTELLTTLAARCGDLVACVGTVVR